MNMLRSAANAFFLALLPWGFMLPLEASAGNIIKIAAPIEKYMHNGTDASYANISATFTNRGIESLDGFDISAFSNEKNGEGSLLTFESRYQLQIESISAVDISGSGVPAILTLGSQLCTEINTGFRCTSSILIDVVSSGACSDIYECEISGMILQYTLHGKIKKPS